MRSLADVVSASGLAVYAEVALVLFALVFVAIVWRVLRPGRAGDFEAARLLPLEEGGAPAPGEPS